MGLVFKTNKVTDESKVAVFLTVIAASNYALLRNLLALADKSLHVSMEMLQSHNELKEPKKPLVAERFKFPRRQQAAMQSAVEYVEELHKLATHCEFGEHL